LQSKQNPKKGKEGDGIRQRKKEMLTSGYRLILTTLWGLPNQTQSVTEAQLKTAEIFRRRRKMLEKYVDQKIPLTYICKPFKNVFLIN